MCLKGAFRRTIAKRKWILFERSTVLSYNRHFELGLLSSTCSVYFMRPQIRRPAALEFLGKERNTSLPVSNAPTRRNYKLIASNCFNEVCHFIAVTISGIYRSCSRVNPTSLRFFDIVNFRTYASLAALWQRRSSPVFTKPTGHLVGLSVRIYLKVISWVHRVNIFVDFWRCLAYHCLFTRLRV